MPTINQDQINGFIRTACTLISAGLGFTATQTTTLTSGLTGVASLVFLGISLYGTWKANTVESKTASVAATLPPTGQITTTPEIAAAVPSDKVVAVAK